MSDLINDIAFLARGIDKLKHIDRSIVDHAADGMKFKDLLSIGSEVFDDGESVLDAISRIDKCNGSGIFGGSGLDAMRSLSNLLHGIESFSMSADISSLLSGNISDLLQDAAGSLLGSSALGLVQSVQSAISAIGSVQSLLSNAVGKIAGLSDLLDNITLSAQSIEDALEGMSGSLLGALTIALCGSACGPSNGSGLPGSPLAALAALAGLNITQLTGISDLASMFSQIASSAASIKSGGKFDGFTQYCLDNLMKKMMGNNNPCGLLGMAISLLASMADEDAYVGDKTFTINIKVPSELNSFSTAMKLLELIKKLMGAVSAAKHAQRASAALARAMACSGYVAPTIQNLPTTIRNPNIKGNQGGPGGLGGSVGGSSGSDIIANTISSLPTANNIKATGTLYGNVFYSNAMSILPSNVIRNNDLNTAISGTPQGKVDFSTANSIALTMNTGIMQYTTSGNTIASTNIPRKYKGE
jgi:hypothetical protein